MAKRGFEFGALFRLCQIFLAAILLYVTASLFTKGAGVLGKDMASCLLRLAGGGLVLLLLHFFYGLFCSLLYRQVHSVFSQWMGTFCLYGAVTLFLGMLRRIGAGENIGLLSPGILGNVSSQVLPRFIGVIGTMLTGLCLVGLAAFNYGHLNAARVAWLRERLSFVHMPRWRREKASQAPASAQAEGEAAPAVQGEAETARPEESIPEEALPSEEAEAVEAAVSETESPPQSGGAGKTGFWGSLGAAVKALFGHGRKERENGEIIDEYAEQYADEQGENAESEDYGDYFANAPQSDRYGYEAAEAREDELSDTNGERASAAVTSGESGSAGEAESAFAAAGSVPISKKPSVEVEPSGDLVGTENVQFCAGRPIPAGSFPPPLDLLGPHRDIKEVIDDQQAQENGQKVILSLADFGVSAELKRTIIGPTVVQYQIQLAPGIKVSKVMALGNDIAVALGVSSIRVEAPIIGTSYVGIELPNVNRRSVPLRQILESEVFQKTKLKLPLPLGQTVDGRILISGLEDLPHLLIAGTTGSGKSIFVNNCIVSLCYHNTPAELRFIMVDPKRVEMGIYESLPHILAKPIVSATGAVHALAWAVREMERRYDVCYQAKVKDIFSYNSKVLPKDRLPHIVIIVDELADLMMTAQKEVEDCIMSLAQKARASGIHLMLATQRPSVNVLTGTIKANIPARVSFALPSAIDSKTILDKSGAQNLLGKGDMLFVSTKTPHPLRIQSPFLDEQTNIRVVEYLRNTFGDPEYVDLEEASDEKGGASSDFLEDSRLEEAIKIVLSTGVASSSGLQRQMRVGFTRAARMVDTMESMGIVGPQHGGKPREILVDEAEALEILEQLRGE
ncbi:DNA translocase FtsK [Pyramidobacter sp.]|uniref:DNA translocase FtsK n=1 Tax=Pyramidobacter sp. TaxID=1943581 RepID=UPI0025FD8C62|nr:DNA translocase FtsK [Pyramidobacter sp.]MCI7403205.1 DNA translocase FtsK [Pyramidobacter sp.]MDY3212109.1 DNA translocase FtsK [Pyramidobacter sp.]